MDAACSRDEGSAPEANQRLYRDVARKLYDQITAGNYKAGDRLPSERALLNQFAVSRATIREAIIALEVQGLVEVRAGSGAHVVSVPRGLPSPRFNITAFELTEARMAIEGEAVALATMLMGEDDMDVLDGLVTNMETANRQGLNADTSDHEFHMLIARSTKNSALVEIIERLWAMRASAPDTKLLLAKAQSANVRPVVVEHRAIVDAIRARNPAGARAAMRAHLGAVLDHLLFTMEEAAVEKARKEARSTRARFSLLREG